MGCNDHMDIDQAGLDFIALKEGVILYPYQDVANLWTIGVGHLILPSDSFSSISNAEVREMLKIKHKAQPNPYKSRVIPRAEAFELLHHEVQRFCQAIRDNVKTTPLNQNQWNALVSLLFNVGEGWIRKGGVRTALDRGDYESAAQAFLAFCKAKVNGVVTTIPGLLKRRQAEVLLWRTPVEVPADNLFEDPEVIAAVREIQSRAVIETVGDCCDLEDGVCV